MILLLLDFETTGLDPHTHSICEVGVALWDTVLQRIIRVADYLVYEPNAVWEAAAMEKNGLTPELCEKYGMPTDKAFRQLMTWANSADVFVAYNGKSFDFPMWDAWAEKQGSIVPNRLRLDPMVDIQWPKDYRSRELFYVAAKHGILNHFIHTGAGDVLTMVTLLSRQPDLGMILEYAKMPDIIIEGRCSIDDRQRVKSNGFNWLFPPGLSKTKKWIKTIKEGMLDKEIQLGKEVGYEVRRLT